MLHENIRIKIIFRYLKDTRKFGIVTKNGSSTTLEGHNNADLGDDIELRNFLVREAVTEGIVNV